MRQLTKAGCKAGCKKVFREVASGVKTDGAQLREAIAEAKVGCHVLNRMTGLGMPVSARIR